MQTQICFPALTDGFHYDTMTATGEDATITKRQLSDICQQNLDSAVISVCNRCLSSPERPPQNETVFIVARQRQNEKNEKRKR